jgi:hypothetical protein
MEGALIFKIVTSLQSTRLFERTIINKVTTRKEKVFINFL